MDFCFILYDCWYGEFYFDYCGVLFDVELMGDDYVVGMCYIIEDLMFDVIVIVINLCVQVCFIYWLFCKLVDWYLYCVWIVIIDEFYFEVEGILVLDVVCEIKVVIWELDNVDVFDDGLVDYLGLLVFDLDFGVFLYFVLVWMVDEVCL